MEVLRVSPRSPRAWKTVFDAVSQFLTEAPLRFTADGMEISSIDVSRAVYVNIYMPKRLFSVYELEHPSVTLPISITEYHKILGRLSPEDELSMSFSSSFIKINMKNPQGVTKEFILPVIDVPEPTQNIDVNEFAARVEISSNQIKEALKTTSIVSRQVVLAVAEKELVLESREGSSVSKVVIKHPSASIESSSPVRSSYSSDYLLNIVKYAEGPVVLEFSEDSPVRISYTVEGIKMTFLLAPLYM